MWSMKKIIFFGDSITQFGWSYEGCWLAELASRYQRKVDVINRGFSGYNSRWCRPVLSQLYPNGSPVEDILSFTIFLGANDSTESPDVQHVPISEYKSNLSDMITHLVSIGIPKERILLLSLPPIDVQRFSEFRKSMNLGDSTKSQENCAKYAQACNDVAVKCSVNFIDVYNTMLKEKNWTEFLNDGLHLSRKGSLFLANLLATNYFDVRLCDVPFCYPDWKTIDYDCPYNSLQ